MNLKYKYRRPLTMSECTQYTQYTHIRFAHETYVRWRTYTFYIQHADFMTRPFCKNLECGLNVYANQMMHV